MGSGHSGFDEIVELKPDYIKLHPREFAWIIENSGAGLVVATPALAAKLEPGATVVSTADTDFGALLASEPIV